MKAALHKLDEGYKAALEERLAGVGEAALQRAYELVHQAVQDGLGLMQIYSIHKELLLSLLSKASTPDECVRIVKATQDILTECLVTFEFTHRGFGENRQVLQALSEGERRFRELADAMPQLVWTADRDGRIDYFNRRLMGFKHQEGMKSAIHQEDWQRTRETWKLGVKSGEAYEIEHRLKQADGSYRWYLSRAVPAYDETGRVIKWYGTSTDIDDHKKAEETVLRAKKEWEQTFDTVPDLIAILDDRHRIVRVNKAMADRMGATPRHCIGLSCYEAIHGLTKPPAFCPHSRSCRDGREHVVEVHEPRLGGDFLVSTTPLRNPAGGLIGSVHVCRDITERKHFETQLKEVAEKYSTLFNNTSDGVWIHNLNGEILEVNDAYCRMSGYSRDELTHMPVGRLEVSESPEEVANHIKKLIESGGHDRFESRHRRKDGTPFDVDITALYYEKDGGRIAIFVRDITERKQAEDLLRKSKAYLREANEYLEQRVRERTMDLQNLMGELEVSRDNLRKLASELVLAEERERKRIAGVLHDEIAQTMAIARMRIDLLQSIAVDDESRNTIREAKEFLLESIRETRALMNDLGNPLLFELGVKAACESLAERLMSRHPIRIRCDIRDSFKTMDPDVKVILFQVIRELLQNVVKHSKASHADVLIEMDGGRVRTEVRDDGTGFDPRKLRAPTSEGGFGLFSIRERLAAFSGSMRIEAMPGTGTVVTVDLPSMLERGNRHGKGPLDSGGVKKQS